MDAQREYAAGDAEGNGYFDYARRFISNPGTRNGLYWPVEPGEKPSPLGPLIGAASRDGYEVDDEPQAYHGTIIAC